MYPVGMAIRQVTRFTKMLFAFGCSVKPRGCNFHFKQAILRYLKKLGLWAKYVQNPDFRKVIRWVLALPFVPHQKAREMLRKN